MQLQEKNEEETAIEMKIFHSGQFEMEIERMNEMMMTRREKYAADERVCDFLKIRSSWKRVWRKEENDDALGGEWIQAFYIESSLKKEMKKKIQIKSKSEAVPKRHLL